MGTIEIADFFCHSPGWPHKSLARWLISLVFFFSRKKHKEVIYEVGPHGIFGVFFADVRVM